MAVVRDTANCFLQTVCTVIWNRWKIRPSPHKDKGKNPHSCPPLATVGTVFGSAIHGRRGKAITGYSKRNVFGMNVQRNGRRGGGAGVEIRENNRRRTVRNGKYLIRAGIVRGLHGKLLLYGTDVERHAK